MMATMGFTKGAKADKQKYRQLLAVFCLAEAEKMKRGEMTLVFDDVDKNRDGYMKFEEYKLLIDTSNFGEEVAKATFNLLD